MKLLFVQAYRGIANGILNLSRSILYKRIKEPKKVLVYRTGSMGDSLCAFPALYAIREAHPHAKLHILTASGANNLVSIDKMLSPDMYDAIIDYQNLSVKEWSKLVRQNKYDLIIQLPQNKAPFKSLLRDLVFFRFVTKIRSGFGWTLEYVPHFRDTQERNNKMQNERDRLLDILTKNGISAGKKAITIHSSLSDRNLVEDLVPKNLKHSRNIALIVGAKRAQNRWPIERFEYLAQELSKEYNLFLVGGPGDEEIAHNILKMSNVHNFAGRCTPVQSALVLRKCVLTISNDTGPMHLSYFSGTPVLALFSSRDFSRIWFPPDDGKNFVFRNQHDKHPVCLSKRCSAQDLMDNIKSHDVLSKARQMLQTT